MGSAGHLGVTQITKDNQEEGGQADIWPYGQTPAVHRDSLRQLVIHVDEHEQNARHYLRSNSWHLRTMTLHDQSICVLQYLYFDSHDNRSLFIPMASCVPLCSTQKHSIKPRHTITPSLTIYTQFYTRGCSIKGTFDAQSKATSMCCSATVCSEWSLSSGISIQKQAPCACLCFPNHSCTGNQTPGFRGKQKPPLSFSPTWNHLEVCASFSCSCPEKCLTVCCYRPSCHKDE